jgi:SAM-dependent methyltransferase
MPDAAILPFPIHPKRPTRTPCVDAVATPDWVQAARSPLHAILDDTGHTLTGPAITVWPATQHTDTAQRAGRYHPDTPRHPTRLRPATAARLIQQYSQPADTMLDLFCGAGTAAVEAVHAGRHSIAIDNNPRWLEATAQNLDYATVHGAAGHAHVLCADTRTLTAPRRWRSTVDLVIATPPIRLTPAACRPDHDNAALIQQLGDDLDATLQHCLPLLRPDGIIAVVTRLVHRHGQLLDPTWPAHHAARRHGLTLAERAAALRVPLRDGRPWPRRARVSHQRRRTTPPVVHDDVLIYRVPRRWPRWLRL